MKAPFTPKAKRLIRVRMPDGTMVVKKKRIKRIRKWKPVCLCLTDTLHKQLTILSRRYEVNRSVIIRNVLRKHIRQYMREMEAKEERNLKVKEKTWE